MMPPAREIATARRVPRVHSTPVRGSRCSRPLHRSPKEPDPGPASHRPGVRPDAIAPSPDLDLLPLLLLLRPLRHLQLDLEHPVTELRARLVRVHSLRHRDAPVE